MTERRHVFESQEIRVTWSKARCTHVAECVRGLPRVFQPGRKPWVMPEAGTAERVAEVVRRCPTGALHFERLDGGPQEPAPASNAVVPLPHGPLLLRGRLEVMEGEGGSLHDTRVALCRCGASRNRPFCDGSHWDAAFDDDGMLGEGGAKALGDEPDGPLRVTPQPGGPLLLEGRFLLASARGETVRGLTCALLCRCGGSRNKPFCDGTHKRVRHEDEGDVE